MKIKSVLHWIVLLVLIIACVPILVAPPATAQEAVSYYVLVKIDFMPDHASEGGFAASWTAAHDVTRQADGSILSIPRKLPNSSYGPPGSSWQIWLDQNRAVHTRPKEYGGGGLEVRWTSPPGVPQPPALWASNQDFRFSVSVVAADGNDWGGLQLREFPVGNFIVTANEGENPWYNSSIDPIVQAGRYSRGFKPTASGVTTFRPKPGLTIPFALQVRLAEMGDDFYIDYHYELVPPGSTPKPIGGGSQPTGGGGAAQPTGGGSQPTGGGPQPTGGGISQPTGGGSQPTGGGISQPTGGGASQPSGTIVLPMPPYPQPGPSANVPGMTLQADQRRVAAGSLILVPVWLIKANNVANINFEVSYNSNVARPEGTITKGSLLDDALFSPNPNESNIIRLGLAKPSGIFGTGSVAYIPFRAVGQPGDRTPLTLSVTKTNDPNGGPLTIYLIHGEIVILTPGGVLPGDCDGDGQLTALDALCSLEMSVRLRPENLTLDMDSDRQVTSRDTVIILQRTLVR